MEVSGSEPGPKDDGPSSWTARVIAPLALVLVVAATVLVVGGSLDTSEDDDQPERERNANSAIGCAQPDAEGAVENGYYVIEPGEDLSVVADRTCIAIERLTRLNPNLDTQTIPIGACIDLRTDGCKALAQS